MRLDNTHGLPRITVVTPSFRSEKYIESTIASVLSQDYPDLDYIILDGAGDSTADILRRYDDHLHYWRSAPDDGQYAAITEGFAMATGDILCWLNADDIFLPRALHVVGETFARFPRIEWLSSVKPGILDANGSLAHVGRIPGFNRDAFLDGFYLPGTNEHGFWIQQESTFFRRSLWERAGGRIPDYPLAGDFALWCELYKHAELIGTEYPLAGFRLVHGQRSQDVETYLAEGRRALDNLRRHAGHDASLPPDPTKEYFTWCVANVDRRQENAGWALTQFPFAPKTTLPLW